MPNVKDHFGLKHTPFTKDIGYKDLFRYDQLEQLFEMLRATVEDGSMALITGRAGTGKTTGIRSFMESLPTTKYRIVYVGQEQRGSGVIARILQELGAKTNLAWANRTIKLTQKLQDTLRSGKNLVLIIDEAHLLDQQTLEDIRLLTNLDMDRSTGVSVFLLGQHWLRGILRKIGNEALYQRLRLRLSLEGLTEEQAGGYIRHHMTLAGSSLEVFNEDAISEIFAAAEGILREINNIAYECLFLASQTNTLIVDKALVVSVLNQRELN